MLYNNWCTLQTSLYSRSKVLPMATTLQMCLSENKILLYTVAIKYENIFATTAYMRHLRTVRSQISLYINTA